MSRRHVPISIGSLAALVNVAATALAMILVGVGYVSAVAPVMI